MSLDLVPRFSERSHRAGEGRTPGGGVRSRRSFPPGGRLSSPPEPGNASGARGAAFNENGGIAGGVYAGSRPLSSNNSHSVSQYDVACYQVSQH